MDWSENAKLCQCWQEKSAYYYYNITTLYGDSNIENVKTTLTHHLSISWKKFGISKVHKIFFSAKCSNEIRWKIQSQDKDFTKATHANSKRQLG